MSFMAEFEKNTPMSEFNLTQQEIEEADIYDREKSTYIHNYLSKFFHTKLSLLNNLAYRIDCYEHGMEEYTTKDRYSAGGHGFCFDNSFGGWENTFSIHLNAIIKCGKDFPIGYYFAYKNRELIPILRELESMTDREIIKGRKWDEKNHLSIITGFRHNNFSD